MMTTDTTTDVLALTGDWERGLWALASVVLAAEQADTPIGSAARQVLDALSLPGGSAPAHGDVRAFTAQVKAPLLQAASLIGQDRFSWFEQSDEALLAQGQASALGARMFAAFTLPHLEDLAARLSTPGASLLDVGTGVGALAVAFAEVFPAVTVTGIDISERVLALARTALADTTVTARVELRQQDVAALDEPQRYDLAWLPAPFIPPDALRAGTGRVATALRPGGWLILGHGRLSDGDPLDEALTRLKTLAYGGTALSDTQAQHLLTSVGLEHVATIPTPPGAPAITIGRRPGP
jgi:SAM-dependent methyltransferase